MKHSASLAAVCAVLLFLSACNDNNSTPPFTGAFRLANGIADSNGLKADISNVPTVGPIGFASASGINIIPEGSYKVQLTPGASGASTFTVDNVSIEHNNLTTLFAYGTLAAGSQGGLTAVESLNAPTHGQAVIQPVHAAYQESQTAPQSMNFSFVPVGSGGSSAGISVVFGSATTSQSVALAAGKYEIKITATPICNPGQPCPAISLGVFDSGPQGISFPGADGSNVFQLAAIDATSSQVSQYGAPVSLLLLDNSGHSTQLFNGQN